MFERVVAPRDSPEPTDGAQPAPERPRPAAGACFPPRAKSPTTCSPPAADPTRLSPLGGTGSATTASKSEASAVVSHVTAATAVQKRRTTEGPAPSAVMADSVLLNPWHSMSLVQGAALLTTANHRGLEPAVDGRAEVQQLATASCVKGLVTQHMASTSVSNNAATSTASSSSGSRYRIILLNTSTSRTSWKTQCAAVAMPRYRWATLDVTTVVEEMPPGAIAATAESRGERVCRKGCGDWAPMNKQQATREGRSTGSSGETPGMRVGSQQLPRIPEIHRVNEEPRRVLCARRRMGGQARAVRSARQRG